MKTQEKPSPLTSRQHLGVRMGARFRAYVDRMHNEGSTYSEIAAHFGFRDPSALSHILHGRRGVSPDRADHIAQVIGVTRDQLQEPEAN